MATRERGPDYYRSMRVQPWDVIDTWPMPARIGYYHGVVISRLMRAGTKPGEPLLKELEKAQHELAKLIEVVKQDSSTTKE